MNHSPDISTVSSSIECVWPVGAIIGEAPLWCTEEKVLYWVDIDGKSIMRFNPKTGAQDMFPQPYEIGCVIKRLDGGFIAATEAGIVELDKNLGNLKIINDPERDEPENRFNDGKCDRLGRFWTGSTDRAELNPTGVLYQINTCNDINSVLNGLNVPNGIGWSPDNNTMYLTESGLGIIYAYNFDFPTGAFSNQRIFAEVDPSEGVLDGLCVDAEGYVWSAHWEGGRVTRYDVDGNIDRVIKMPVPLITSLAFGGENLDQLYVTTACLGLTDAELEEYPLSGGLFVLHPGMKGLPETPFGG